MSILNLALTSARPDTYLTDTFETPGGNQAIAQRVLQFVNALATGSESAVAAGSPPSIAISVQGNAVRASGTLTLSSVIAPNTFAINGVTFTARASGAGANEFNVGLNDTATAVNAAAAINASVTGLIAGYVTATSALGVVTVKSAFYGLSGNQVTLTGSANIVASVTRLAGGLADATAQTLSF